MGYIKLEVKKLYKLHGGRNPAIKEVTRWFKRGAAKLKDSTLKPTRIPMKPGMIYVFRYEDPKYIEQLDWWDQHPVVLALDQVEGVEGKNDCGINLNLLPDKVRIELLDVIYTRQKGFLEKQTKEGSKTTNNPIRQKPIPKFTYESAKRFLERFGYDFAIRQYIPKLKRKQQIVAYERWPYMAICNLLDPESETNTALKINERKLELMFKEHLKNRLKRTIKK